MLDLKQKILTELNRQNAVLLAHYYVDSELQQLAEASGGIVSDSLEMARFGRANDAHTLIIAGVKFMGETAKILSPEKTILVVDANATCSLDLSCPIDEFDAFCDAHSTRAIVVYANTSAAVKARADWMVTSSSALPVIKYLHNQGEKILWAPDRHLGAYIRDQIQVDMVVWQGSCVVHEAFKATALASLRKQIPDAAVLVHPESPLDVIAQADVVGSTTQLIDAVRTRDEQKFIIATDNGIFHKMREVAPGKILIEAPTAGIGATCESCAHCDWMAMNSLEKCLHALETHDSAITLDQDIIKRAQRPINRLLKFTAH